MGGDASKHLTKADEQSSEERRRKLANRTIEVSPIRQSLGSIKKTPLADSKIGGASPNKMSVSAFAHQESSRLLNPGILSASK